MLQLLDEVKIRIAKRGQQLRGLVWVVWLTRAGGVTAKVHAD